MEGAPRALSMEPNDYRTRVGPSSWISVSFLGGILLAAMTGTVYAVRATDGIAALRIDGQARGEAIESLTAAVSDLRVTVDRLADGAEFRVWAANLGRLNPTIVLPQDSPFNDGGRRK